MSNPTPTLLANAILSVEDGNVCIRSEQSDLLYQFTPYPGFKRTTQPLAEVLRVAQSYAEAALRRDQVSPLPEPAAELQSLAALLQENHKNIMLGFHRNDEGAAMHEALKQSEQLLLKLEALVSRFGGTTTV